MGKTKTAFVAGADVASASGEEKYKQRLQKKAQAAAEGHVKSSEKKDKVRIPGLGGGQRIATVTPEPIVETTEEQLSVADITKSTAGPKKRGKKYSQAKTKIDKNKLYPVNEAVQLVKTTSFSKFNGTVELHLLVRKTGLSVNVDLPHSAGKAKKIEVADDKTVEKLKSGKVDFDVLLATAEMMPKLVPFAKLLGPKGLMPNPKTGTLIKSNKDADKFSGSTLTVKTEKKQPVIHTVVGKVDQGEKELQENVDKMLDAIGRKQILKAYMKPTMGPSVKLQI